MKKIKDNSIFKVRCTVDSAPRDIYIVKDLELVKKLFRNAYILPKVNWAKIGNFHEFMTGKDLDGMLPSRWSGTWYANGKEGGLREQITKESDEYKEEVLSMYTVVPFTPSLGDYKENIQKWALDSKVLVLSNDRNVNGRGLRTQANQFYSVLLSNSHNMGLLVEGVLYDSPCRLCSFVLSKLAGECEIYAESTQRSKMCSPRLTFNAQLFTNRNVPTLQPVDYAEVLSLWKEDQKMEV